MRFQTPRNVPGNSMNASPVQMYRVSNRESVVSRDAEMLKISVVVSGRPASLSIRVASADIEPRSVSLFHRDGAWEKYVVLKVNVLVKVSFESRESLI